MLQPRPAFEHYIATLKSATASPFPEPPAQTLVESRDGKRRPQAPAAALGATDYRTSKRTRRAQLPLASHASSFASRAPPRLDADGHTPLGTGAAQGAASLGALAPKASRLRAGDRASAAVGRVRAPDLAGQLAAATTAREHTAANAGRSEREAARENARAGELTEQARRLWREADAAAKEQDLPAARVTTSRAREVDGQATDAARQARQAECEAALWRRAEGIHATNEGRLAARIDGHDPHGAPVPATERHTASSSAQAMEALRV